MFVLAELKKRKERKRYSEREREKRCGLDAASLSVLSASELQICF